MVRFRYLLFILLFIGISVSAQNPLRVRELPTGNIPVGNQDTLVYWILNYLHGGGGIIDTSSISFTGNYQALGRFWQGSDIGIDKGLILSNGKVTSAMGSNSSGLMSDHFGTEGDTDLLRMYNDIFKYILGLKDTTLKYTGDAAVIEFTYKPYGDEVVLTYVFASEEYPWTKPQDVDLTGFPNTNPPNQMFDLFGISIEQNDAFINRALVPSINNPPPNDILRWVNVWSINSSNNSDFFQSNPTPGPFGQNLGTQFDGLTKLYADAGLMRIKRVVKPCQNYKVKIAIEDFIFYNPPVPYLDSFSVNSAVFLRDKSLKGSKNNPGWKTTYEFTPNPDPNGYLIEGGCNNLEVTFTLDEYAQRDYYIPFRVLAAEYRNNIRVSNLATGEVYTHDSVRFTQGGKEITILVEAINLTADVPNVSFQYATNPCEGKPNGFGGIIFSGKIPMTLRNNEPFTLTQNPKTYLAYCKETLDLTVTDVTLGGVDPIKYYWDGNIISRDTISYQVNASPDYVTVAINDGCGNKATAQVEIINRPIELESISDAFLCGPGQSVVIPVNAITPAYPDYTIDHVRWYKLPGNTPLGDQNGNEITVVYDDVVGAAIWTCGFEVTDVCGGTQTWSFEVNQSELTLGSDVWICRGESTTLTTNSAAKKYAWYDINNPSDTLSFTQSVTVTPDVTTTYELWIFDNCDHVQTATITVNVDQFVPAISIDPASAEICPGTTITLTANDAESWEWQPGGQTTQKLVLNPLIPGDYTYTLTSSSLYCTDKVVSRNFTVYPMPPVAFSFTPPSEACTGEEITFTYGGGTPDTWKWDFGDGTNSDLQNPTHAYTNAGIYNISLLVKQYICSNDTSVQINIDPLPVPDFQADQVEGCLPVTVQFTDFSVDAFPNADYDWDFGDGTIITGDRNPVHEYTIAGTYSVKLKVSNTDRCAEEKLLPNLIKVYANPEVDAKADPYLTTLDAPEINFFDLSNDSTVNNWNWSFGDGTTSTEENPSHIYQDAGSYTVQFQITTINGCKSDTTLEVALTQDVKLFIPNAFTPNGDGLNDFFEIKGTPVTDFNLYIFDRWGGQIYSTHSFNDRWDGNNSGGEPVPAGTYVYQISGTDYMLRPLSFKGTVNVIR
ncbi:MAG: PKD domain-containing protein [Bacteroidales bacterium]|jgi:gliding motility-associated-like protein